MDTNGHERGGKRRWKTVVGVWGALTVSVGAVAEPVKVELREWAPGRFELLRAGEPYVVRGAGGEDLKSLAAAGANSVRTWGAEGIETFLDEAHAVGLTVTVGIWVAHERHGFDYDDAAAVRAQIEEQCRAVDRIKDHPALLMWGVGNEVELRAPSAKAWDTVEAIAAYIQRVDPHHPVMTVTAHPSAATLAEVKRRCPSIDLLGCNSYGPVAGLARDLRAGGWDGAYLVTEWGCDGFWEVEKTSWGAEIEPTSAEKALQRALRYAAIMSDRDRCLGNYAFVWGQKQEKTPTWFGVFAEDGRATESVEVLQFLWTGKFPPRRAPQVAPLRLNGAAAFASVRVARGAALTAVAAIVRGGGAEQRVVWELLHERTERSEGGDAEERSPTAPLRDAKESASEGEATLAFIAPEKPGAYRLFAYVQGSGQTVATTNFPFLVE